MVFTFRENALNLCIFTHAPVPHPKLQVEFFENLFPPRRKGWKKLWFALSKFNQKIWRLGTLVYLYFVWVAIQLHPDCFPDNPSGFFWLWYKHLVYVDFVSFIRKSWNCYLKDTLEFFSTMDLAKNNPWMGYTFQRGIRFFLRNWCSTILHGDVSV